MQKKEILNCDSKTEAVHNWAGIAARVSIS